MKRLLILIDDLSDWSPYYPSDNLMTVFNYLSVDNKENYYLINLSKNMNYLGQGYYASLLAEARDDKIIPGVKAINNINHFDALAFRLIDFRLTQAQIDYLNQCSNKDQSVDIALFFGKSMVNSFEKLGKIIFDEYNFPLLTLKFTKENEVWRLTNLVPLNISNLNDEEESFFADRLNEFSKQVWRKPRARKLYRYEMAILVDPEEKMPPSNKKALQKFIDAGKELGILVEKITENDFARLPEYDSLFIRTTTVVNHFSYAFAKKAEENNLIVMDSTQAIIRCANKVYLHHMLKKHSISTPKSELLFRDTIIDYTHLVETLGLPIVIKVPDGAFSKGVKKVKTKEELILMLNHFFQSSSILLAQEYTYTDFDWRIGVLNNRAIYACKYYMVKDHWQILHYKKGSVDEGGVEAFGIHQVPKEVIKLALKACRYIGNDLYGVDIKVIDDVPMIIEINDNPSIDAGCEDIYLGDSLYQTIMLEFLNRMEYKRVHYND